VKVQISATARQQVAAFASWWNEHRRAARVRVEDALEAAIAALARNPTLGHVYSRNTTYRTWRLRGTPYVLFYRVDAAADTVWIASAWSAVRGSGPELP
jgi:plasmid stabilization system protein ParE